MASKAPSAQQLVETAWSIVDVHGAGARGLAAQARRDAEAEDRPAGVAFLRALETVVEDALSGRLGRGPASIH